MELEPIGTVRSPYAEVGSIPRSRDERSRTEAVVEVLPEFAEGLKDLDGFSHVVLISHLHRSTTTKLTAFPPMDDGEGPRGVFATRSPHRPNHIAMTIVELVRVRGRELLVRGIDLLDGTPVLDIKPHIPYDARTPVKLGWLEGRLQPPE